MAVLPTVTAVLLHYSAMDIWTKCIVVSTRQREMTVLPTVTAILLHYSNMNTWTECIVVSTGQRENGGSACSYCSTVTL